MIKSDNNKLGVYITKLMTTALDKECDGFVRNLALSELNRINADKATEANLVYENTSSTY